MGLGDLQFSMEGLDRYGTCAVFDAVQSRYVSMEYSPPPNKPLQWTDRE